MKALHLKFVAILFFLAMGTIIFLNAQNGNRSPQQSGGPKNEPDLDEPVEDIGKETGDDPWEEMNQLVVAYYNKEGTSFKGLIKLIDDNGQKEKILEELPFEYAVLNEEYSYSLDKIEVVKKKNLLLIADHANKIISLSREPLSPETKAKLFDIAAFQKMMEESKANAKVTQIGSEKILTIENIQNPQVQGYRIYYDPQTYRITKMLIGMVRLTPLDDTKEATNESTDAKTTNNSTTKVSADSDKSEEIDTYTYYIEIIYTETNLLNSRDGNFNPENKFVHIVNNKAILNKSYSDYQLMVADAGAEPKDSDSGDK